MWYCQLLPMRGWTTGYTKNSKILFRKVSYECHLQMTRLLSFAYQKNPHDLTNNRLSGRGGLDSVFTVDFSLCGHNETCAWDIERRSCWTDSITLVPEVMIRNSTDMRALIARIQTKQLKVTRRSGQPEITPDVSSCKLQRTFVGGVSSDQWHLGHGYTSHFWVATVPIVMLSTQTTGKLYRNVPRDLHKWKMRTSAKNKRLPGKKIA